MKPFIYFRNGRWRCVHPNTRWVGVSPADDNTASAACWNWKHRGRDKSQWVKP